MYLIIYTYVFNNIHVCINSGQLGRVSQMNSSKGGRRGIPYLLTPDFVSIPSFNIYLYIYLYLSIYIIIIIRCKYKLSSHLYLESYLNVKLLHCKIIPRRIDTHSTPPSFAT